MNIEQPQVPRRVTGSTALAGWCVIAIFAGCAVMIGLAVLFDRKFGNE